MLGFANILNEDRSLVGTIESKAWNRVTNTMSSLATTTRESFDTFLTSSRVSPQRERFQITHYVAPYLPYPLFVFFLICLILAAIFVAALPHAQLPGI